MSKKILVTGGTGYIGSHTVVELQNAGFDVIIIDNLSNSDIEVLNRIKEITGVKPEFAEVDLTDEAGVEDFFRKYGNIDSVIHFAALKAVGESVEKPLDYYRNNIFGLVNLLEAMAACEEGSDPLQRGQTPRVDAKNQKINFIFSSSCVVYGQPDELPVTEKAPIKKAESPYGNTKQIAEDIIADTAKARNGNMNALFLRYFNPIGAHESGLIGELPKGTPANLVPYVTQTAAGIREFMNVYGNDYPTPDGTGIRDYIHVVDLAKAHVKALKRLIESKNKSNLEIFNLGAGKGSSVLEIINTFKRINKIKVPYKITARRPGDIAEIWADTSLANRELGWQTEKSLEDALRDAWNWEKSYRSKKSAINKCKSAGIDLHRYKINAKEHPIDGMSSLALIHHPIPKQPIPEHARKVFNGEIFDIFQWEQELYDGSKAIFEKLKRPSAAVIIPIMADGGIIIAEQEQPGRAPFLGMPAGRADKGENILDAAKRELLEETGCKAREFISWFSYQPYHKIEWEVYFFVARGCRKIAEQNLDAGEKIELKYISFDEFIELAANGKFPDRELQIKILQAKLDENKMGEIHNLFMR